MLLRQHIEQRDCRELARLCAKHKVSNGLVWIGYLDENVYEIKVEKDSFYNFNTGQKGGYKQLALLLGFNDAFRIKECKSIYLMIQKTEDVLEERNKELTAQLSEALDQFFTHQTA